MPFVNETSTANMSFAGLNSEMVQLVKTRWQGENVDGSKNEATFENICDACAAM